MPRGSTYLTQPLSRPAPLGDEYSQWFWNPNRVGILLAPEWFRSKVKEIDENLEVTWNKQDERWQVWVRKPSLQSRLCQGWLLMFQVKTPQNEYVPLDERTLAKIYSMSLGAYGNAQKYFDAIIREDARDRAKAEQEEYDRVDYIGADLYRHTKPWVGYGTRHGESKVVGQ